MGQTAPPPRDASAPASANTASPVEEIAQAYLETTHGDSDLALRCAITDALADLLEADHKARKQSRLISRGYVRAGVQDAPQRQDASAVP